MKHIERLQLDDSTRAPSCVTDDLILSGSRHKPLFFLGHSLIMNNYLMNILIEKKIQMFIFG